MPRLVSASNTLNQRHDELSGELERLRASYQNLQDRHTALFKLNKLSQECTELNSFFEQVHQVISGLMVAKISMS